MEKTFKKNYRPFFSFEKKDGKWKKKLNAETAFYFFTTLGFPIEMFIEEINSLPEEDLRKKIVMDWFYFCEKEGLEKGKDFENASPELFKKFIHYEEA